MNNFVIRFSFVASAVLLVLSFLFNKWINKELAPTVKPSAVVAVKKMPPEVEVKEYDMNSDYPLSAPVTLEDKPLEVKKPQRILDEKIIYEMPTSNKFLLQ